jgi:hypothetical protein
MYRFTADQRRRRIGVRQHLSDPAATVEQVAASLVGLHSSDPVTVYLTCRARLADFRKLQLEDALYESRSLLRMLGMRRTMFVVPHDLGAVMDSACTQALAPQQRRRLVGYLESQGVTEDGAAWLTRVEDATMAALGHLGPATARELSAAVPDLRTKLTFGEGKKWGGEIGVSTRVLFLLATSGRIVRGRPLGTWVSTQYRWVELGQWLPGGLPKIETEVAQTELVRRWLRSYGPGSLTDISWWTGWSKGITRRALEACAAVAVEMDGSAGFALADDLEPIAGSPTWAAFLPGLDATIMAWKERDWYLGDHRAALYDRNGNAGPSIWVDGRAVGGWSQRPDGEIRYRLLEDIGSEGRSLVAAEAAKLESWLGESRFMTRFRTPLEKALATED